MLMQVRTALLAGALVVPAGYAQAQSSGMDQSDTTYSRSTQQQTRATQASANADSQTQQQLFQMLRQGNQAEIELSRLAQQQAQSNEVKQYAQRMIQDHQQFVQQLDRAAPSARAMGNDRDPGERLSAAGGLTSSTDAGQSDNASDLQTRERGASAGPNAGIGGRETTPGTGSDTADTGAASSADATGGSDLQSRERGASAGPNAGIGGRDTAHGAGYGVADSSRSEPSDRAAMDSSGQADAQVYGFAAGTQGALPQILSEVHQQNLQSTRQMLSEKDGTEFDKAYIGNQIMMHQHMLNKLQVFSRYVDQDAQQVLQQGQQTVREHLEEARKIMDNLDRQG